MTLVDTLLGVFARVRDAALGPFMDLAAPSERVFVGYLAAAFVLAVVVWAAKARGRVSLARFLFPRALWLHRSALLDYRLLFVRALVGATLFAPLVVSSTAIAFSTLALLTRAFGASPVDDVSRTTAVVVFTIASFVTEDAARYWLHRLSHRVPALWELHKIHHSAEVLTPFTVYRTHPIESLLMRTGSAVAIGVAIGVASWALRRGASPWEIAGVHGLAFAWNALGANLRHSHVWLSFGRAAEHVVVSPAQHQIHHSVEARHHDKNFGSALAVWDFAFGTLYTTTPKRERLTFGLAPREKNHRDDVVSALVDPLRAVALRARARLVDVARLAWSVLH